MNKNPCGTPSTPPRTHRKTQSQWRSAFAAPTATSTHNNTTHFSFYSAPPYLQGLSTSGFECVATCNSTTALPKRAFRRVPVTNPPGIHSLQAFAVCSGHFPRDLITPQPVAHKSHHPHTTRTPRTLQERLSGVPAGFSCPPPRSSAPTPSTRSECAGISHLRKLY